MTIPKISELVEIGAIPMKTSAPFTEIRVGDEYRDRNGRLCTVVDVWKTYNMTGELVKTRFVSTHTFLGQVVRDCDVLEITIRKGQN